MGEIYTTLTSDEEDQIKHYGILGMKWGRRKKPDGGYEPSGKRKRGERSEDRRKVDHLRENPVATLTNSELQAVNQRLQLEQTYASLTTKNNPANQIYSQGRSIAKGLLGAAQGANTVYNLANSRMVKDIRSNVGDRATTAGYAAIRQQIKNNRK